jgi:HAD superfamily hydrolase (TIGR01548 family)
VLTGDTAFVDDHVARVRRERAELTSLLERLGQRPRRSEANFVLADFDDATWVADALAGLGIGVRRFPQRPGLSDSLRITCPGEADSFDRLSNALETALAPEALLFDVDGVLVDVSASYRETIVRTAASFGVRLSAKEIRRAKEEGDANNDWELTRRLLSRRGVDASLESVTRRFEAIYQGEGDRPGLRENERMIPSRPLLESLARRLPLALVTGRPREDADRFLDRFGLRDLFRAVVTMEDTPLKPDPAPVRLALRRLGVTRAWMVGDTPDDVRAARRAGVVPLGIPAPGEESGMDAALLSAGAACVLDSLDLMKEMIR